MKNISALQRKKTITELVEEIEENVKRIWKDSPPLIDFVFSTKSNPLGTRLIGPAELRYASFEELSDQEFCEFLKEVSLRNYFKSNI